ncbi:Uncharacterized protein FWK35_00018547, partial [Aphis craccivora]
PKRPYIPPFNHPLSAPRSPHCRPSFIRVDKFYGHSNNQEWSFRRRVGIARRGESVPAAPAVSLLCEPITHKSLTAVRRRHLRRPFFHHSVVIVEKDSISAAMCPGMFPYLHRPHIYVYTYIYIYILYAYTSCPGFTRLRYIRSRVCVCAEGEIAHSLLPRNNITVVQQE